jgi:superfamily II DNA/RNA helicase
MRLEVKQPQALIIAPTRELAKQIHDVVKDLATQMTGLNVQLLIGGTSTEDDVADLKANGPQVLIGCPGRVHDILRRQPAIGRGMQMLVLDEADEMLSAGFNEQIYNIFQQLNTNVQVCLFSATMPPELHALTDKFMRDPVRILVKSEMLTLEGISQYHVALETDHDKYATLKDLFTRISVSQCIIYCNSIRRVSDLAEAMTNDGFPVCSIHSGMEKDVRDKAYRDFRSGQHRVLISSNVTARGIDGGAGVGVQPGSGGGGGGVGLLGQGSSGAGGTYGTATSRLGLGGSGGNDAIDSYSGGSAAGSFGGGGGGGSTNGGAWGGNGGSGGVRIIWGTGRSFPSTNTGDL